MRRRFQHLVDWLLWPVLLATLVLPAGLGHLDLCQCVEGEHGALCDPPVERTCCGDPKPARDEDSGRPCDGCPSLDLAQSDSPRLTARDPLADVAFPALPPAPVAADTLPRSAPAPLAAQPRPPPQRLHLLLGVFRL